MKKLRPYQKKIFRYTLQVKHPALFVEMRLGKTLITIRRIELYTGCHKVLIVAPYSAFNSWRNELQSECGACPVELIGTTKDREKIFNETIDKFKWFLFNKEGFLHFQSIHKYKWNVTILDESTFIKSPTSKVSKYYTENFRNVDHRWILTGLPDPESELDYFQQLKFLDPNILGIKNYYQFKFKYFAVSEFGCDITNAGKKFLTSRLAQHCYFLSRKQAGMYMEKIYIQRKIKMPPKIKKIYTKIAKEFILEVDEYIRLTKYAGAKFAWLRQLCCGVTYINDTDKELIWDGKLQLLQELYQGELKKTPLVIWCHFVLDIESIYKRFHKKVRIGIIRGKVSKRKRDMLVSKFQKGLLDWLLIQPVCMEFGEDLSITSTCIYYSTPTGLKTRAQTEDRIIDVTKKEPRLIIDFVIESSVEVSLIRSLHKKEKRGLMMKQAIEYIKKDLHT